MVIKPVVFGVSRSLCDQVKGGLFIHNLSRVNRGQSLLILYYDQTVEVEGRVRANYVWLHI